MTGWMIVEAIKIIFDALERHSELVEQFLPECTWLTLIVPQDESTKLLFELLFPSELRNLKSLFLSDVCSSSSSMSKI
jgi:hypothetical protein